MRHHERLRRIAVVNALDDLMDRKDGVTFQRLARRLLEERFPGVLPHAETRDLGRDATFVFRGRPAILCASLTATGTKVTEDLRRAQQMTPPLAVAVFCTPKSVTNERIASWRRAASDLGVELVVLEREWVIDQCLRPANAWTVVDDLRVPHDAVVAPRRSSRAGGSRCRRPRAPCRADGSNGRRRPRSLRSRLGSRGERA